MAKVDIELVKRVMERNQVDTKVMLQVIEDIHMEMDNQPDEEGEKPVKKQFVFLASDPHGELEGKDLIGWVLQIPEEDSPGLTEERLFRSAYEFNMTKKGRKLPVRTIAEVCENVSQKISKEQKVWIKTKEPVLLLRTSNKVPILAASKEKD
ncbi:MAG: hypothetical protein A2Y14_03370 [Verrucomicrobia bacterium GWF2_51_19]|nr:MAG: hypothetical protein A2Y14_03370 [Verrucomicrobia bacterium GWF2_51_19]